MSRSTIHFFVLQAPTEDNIDDDLSPELMAFEVDAEQDGLAVYDSADAMDAALFEYLEMRPTIH